MFHSELVRFIQNVLCLNIQSLQVITNICINGFTLRKNSGPMRGSERGCFIFGYILWKFLSGNSNLIIGCKNRTKLNMQSQKIFNKR